MYELTYNDIYRMLDKLPSSPKTPKQEPCVQKVCRRKPRKTKTLIRNEECITLIQPFSSLIFDVEKISYQLLMSIHTDPPIWKSVTSLIGNYGDTMSRIIVLGWIKSLLSNTDSNYFTLVNSRLLIGPLFQRFLWCERLQIPSPPSGMSIQQFTDLFREHINWLIGMRKGRENDF
jgi:hypothetical protein